MELLPVAGAGRRDECCVNREGDDQKARKPSADQRVSVDVSPDMWVGCGRTAAPQG
jgi:hypothetical protein